MPRLLAADELERSPVVANCRMNRERGLTGSNGYGVAVGLDPLAWLRARPAPTAWLDLCCGSARALIEAAAIVRQEPRSVAIVGVDLVGIFAPAPPDLRLITASLSTWVPDRAFDLITCVHGLHYIGDKLALIARAGSWLTADGLFVAHLDLSNLRLAAGHPAPRRFAASLRRAGLSYDSKRRLVRCQGRRVVSLPYRYLGADDAAGPNSTGQPAVNSVYEATRS